MSKIIKISLIILLALTLTACAQSQLETTGVKENLGTNKITINHMKITSSAFADDALIPSQYSCDSENINPPLAISEVPKEAKSLVLIMNDPDAPMGTWLHWTVWNISPDTTEIAADSVPAGALEGKTDFGTPGYGGPCPPSGTHRYFFKLFALDQKLNLEAGASLSALEQAMANHIIDQAELIGKYQRN